MPRKNNKHFGGIMMPGWAGRLIAGMASTGLLLVPALWNGFPLLQYDTGGYLARWYEGSLEVSRSVVYGLFITAGSPLHFWPVAILQSAITVWTIALVLRVHGGAGRPLLLVCTIAGLGAGTSLAWLADLLLTDIFAPVSVLALYLLVMHAGGLYRFERAGLVLLLAFGAATHSATLAVLLVLALAAFAFALIRRDRVPVAGVVRAGAALALGALMLLSANYLVARRLSWTPGGYGIVFARLLEDGIVGRYLAAHCPDRRLRLCAHRHELPAGADMFLWGTRPNEARSLFDRLGRFDGLGAEMRTIVLDSLREYPWLQLQTGVRAMGRQLAQIGTGEGVVNTIWHTYAIINRFAPHAVPAMRAARQQRQGLSFGDINRLHVPLALACAILLPIVMLLGWRGLLCRDAATLAAFVAMALLGNAAICGILSNPHDRYGSRLAPLAPLALAVAALSWAGRWGSRDRPWALVAPAPSGFAVRSPPAA
jgi:hypothetical protein